MSENGMKLINVLLAREELLLILRMLRAPVLAGLDDDPAGVLSLEQQSLALAVAGRALRARELAQLREDGELAIHTALLAAVGVCAYPQKTVFVYHWPANADAVIRYFGHVRENEIVAHTRPADVLHLFTRLPAPAHLVTQLFAACGWEDGPTGAAQDFSVPAAVFADVRRLATEGAVPGAVALLRNNRVAADSARAFVMTLAEAPRLSIIQMRKQGDGRIQAHDFTLVQNSQRSWLVTNQPSDNAGPIAVKTTDRAEISALLTDWLR